MNNIGVFLGAMTFMVIMGLSLVLHYRKAAALLRRWADENGFTLVQQERREFRRGPFFWSSSKDQVVYYVTVRDRGGRLRHVWVRVGSWFLGIMSDKTEVKWDDET